MGNFSKSSLECLTEVSLKSQARSWEREKRLVGNHYWNRTAQKAF